MPPSGLGRYRENLLMGSKGEKFHRNLIRRVVKDLMCLGEGGMILERKRILGKKCWLRERVLEKKESLGFKVASEV